MKHLLTLFTVFFVSVSVAFATDYTIGEDATTNSYILPIKLDGTYSTKFSISQQIYLASELTEKGATEGNISAIKFYYVHADNTSVTRQLEVWMMETDLSQFSMTDDNPGKLVCNSSYKAGTKVFDGNVNIHKDDYSITFDPEFHWGGTKNILLTVYDKTGSGVAKQRHILMATTNPRFVHKASTTTPLTLWNIADLYNTAADSYKSSGSEITGHKYVNKITFTFADALPTPSTPSDLTVNATTANSASLAWSSVSGAASYDLQQSNNGSDWSELASGETGTSFEWSGLEAGSTHYVRIRANNASGSSEWSETVSFTTDAVHTHDGITFDKWNSTNDIPLSGNYYLAADITISGVGLKDISGSLNLCLNGHTISFTQSSGGIQINNSASLTIFDNIGGGFITSPNGTATIQVNSGGRLTLHGGSIRNSASNPPVHLSDDTSILSLDMTDGTANEELLALANGYKTNVHINRSFTSASYNTICLPFELKNSDLESVFGSGYSLASLSNSTFDGSTIELEFSTSSTTLYAGKPYLIQPAHNVSAPTFNNVTVSAASLSPVSTEFVDFIGVFSPTVVGSGENILFLSENNELKWNSNVSGALKGFRAYFEVKGEAKAAVRARIVQQAEDTEAVINTSAGTKSQKLIINDQLIIERNGVQYNAQGQRIQ